MFVVVCRSCDAGATGARGHVSGSIRGVECKGRFQARRLGVGARRGVKFRICSEGFRVSDSKRSSWAKVACLQKHRVGNRGVEGSSLTRKIKRRTLSLVGFASGGDKNDDDWEPESQTFA